MATVTFTATLPNGDTETRSSGTMAYVAASIIVKADGSGSVFSWHKTFAAAHRAARTGYTAQVAAHHGDRADVIPVIPTKINGKVTADMFAEGWGDIPAEALAPLVAAKLVK